jgi:polyphosphate kinase 2 (PPK2 family)|nr:polyphosphate:AMP phosphotransferase [Kofleriaceae bacterium]
MFEAAEVEQTIAKDDFKREVATLREQLLDAQGELRHADFPVIIVVGGVDGAGKGETVNTLLEWLDPRFVQTVALGAPTDEELERPRMWRFWRALPARGRIAIFHGGWHSEPIVDRVYRRISTGEMERQLADVVAFERLLVEDGTLLVKLWMHLSKDRQRKRLKALAKDKETRWRVTATDWEHFDMYDRFKKVSSTALRKTSTGDAPWTIVGATDRRFQLLSVGRTLLDRLRAQLAARKTIVASEAGRGMIVASDPGRGATVASEPGRGMTVASDASRSPTTAPATPVSGASPPGARTIVSSLDLAQSVDARTYDDRLERAQGELNEVCRHAARKGIATAIVMEGVDAAGKGGAIRRFTGALDARMYRVVPIAAPTEEERAHPYLWRFWRAVPGRGRITLFDRSWYGRVLVERVEGFCQPADWQRAYAEINDFEDQLVRFGVVVVKFWLHISQDEQLKRFREREQTPWKRFKITAEDWRNRDKWPDYERAVNEMIERTSSEVAPWTLVESEDKRFARLKVLETVRAAIEAAL